MQKLLTISIPTWNRAPLLESLLNEVTNQIRDFNLEDKIELLVSNNNSSDNTDEILKSFQKRFDFITYNMNDDNIGGKSNVLKSMELASSQYILFLGDDDRITNSCLPEIIGFLESHTDTGLLIDISKFKRNTLSGNTQLTLNEVLEKFFWYIGNAGFFIVRASFIKDNLLKFNYDFLNDSWCQTQLMIMGLYNNKNLKSYVKHLNIISESIHGEVMIYSSYYLWITCYFDLFKSITDISPDLDEETVNAAKKYLNDNILQTFYNILQCGVFLDSEEIKQKTVKHISKNMHLFPAKEKVYLKIIVVTLSLPSGLSRLFSNMFILSTRGTKGINKKNEFVKNEMSKKLKIKNTGSIIVREFPG